MSESMNDRERTDAEHLEIALEHGIPRFFRAGGGKARGRTGRGDVREFVENLALLQDCGLRMGEQLRMDTVSHCAIYEAGSTIAYRYDPESNPRHPMVVGAMVNRQMPMRDLLAQLADL